MSLSKWRQSGFNTRPMHNECSCSLLGWAQALTWPTPGQQKKPLLPGFAGRQRPPGGQQSRRLCRRPGLVSGPGPLSQQPV
jgi:hypothetical protein